MPRFEALCGALQTALPCYPSLGCSVESSLLCPALLEQKSDTQHVLDASFMAAHVEDRRCGACEAAP